MLAGRLLVEEAAQVIGACGMAQFAQRLGFDLTNPLARHVKLLADFFQGVVGVHVDTEAHSDLCANPCAFSTAGNGKSP